MSLSPIFHGVFITASVRRYPNSPRIFCTPRPSTNDSSCSVAHFVNASPQTVRSAKGRFITQEGRYLVQKMTRIMTDGTPYKTPSPKDAFDQLRITWVSDQPHDPLCLSPILDHVWKPIRLARKFHFLDGVKAVAILRQGRPVRCTLRGELMGVFFATMSIRSEGDPPVKLSALDISLETIPGHKPFYIGEATEIARAWHQTFVIENRP